LRETVEKFRTCMTCRWCMSGRECRFFDTDREARIENNSARTCPYFEERGLLNKLDDITEALREIADRIGWLQ